MGPKKHKERKQHPRSEIGCAPDLSNNLRKPESFTNDKERRFFEFISNCNGQYKQYFNQKEVLCRIIVLLEAALLGWLFVSPAPDWYPKLMHLLQGTNYQFLIKLMPVGLMVVVLIVLFFFHSVLLFQVRMRKVAAILTKVMSMALLTWCYKPLKFHEVLPATNPDSYIENIAIKHANKFDKFVDENIYPHRSGIPKSDSDVILMKFPEKLLDMLVNDDLRSFSDRPAKYIVLLSLGILIIAAITVISRSTQFILAIL